MLDFPNPPLANGQQFVATNGVLYQWSSLVGAWIIPADQNSVTILYGPTPPSPAVPGQLWFYTDDSPAGGTLYIYYNDGNSQQWIPASPAPAVGDQTPITLNVADFPGVDLGAKLNNAMLSLPDATGGTVDARSIVGSQTAAATIVIPPYVTVLLGKVTLVCSGSPAITYSSFCNLLGAGRAQTIIQSGVASSSMVQSDNTVIQRYSFRMEGVTLQQTSLVGMTSLNLTNTSSSRFVNCLFQGAGNTGTGTGILLQGTPPTGTPGCYYNQFYQCDAFTCAIGVDLDNVANSHMFVGYRSNACAVGVRFGHTAIANQNVFYDPMIEASTVDNVVFDAFSFSNTINNPRLESPGIPYVRNLTGALYSMVINATVAGGIAYVDETGHLTFTNDRQVSVEGRRVNFNSGALTAGSTPAVTVTQTWNNVATVFNGMLIDITNTASAADSPPLMILVDGGHCFRVTKAGTVYTMGTVLAWGATAIPAGGLTGAGLRFSSTANFGVFFGSGVPNKQAAKGSLYLRSDGTTTNDRMYVNIDGATAWTAVTTAT